MLTSIGDTVQLTAFAFDKTGSRLEDAQVAWSSSDTTVADADGNGLVRARGIGHATIVASAAGGADSAIITVDPLMILEDYCSGCHKSAGHSSTGFPLQTCPACHLMNRDPDDARHGLVSVDHRRASDGYALVDAHAPLLCEACHQLDVPGGASYWDAADPNDCIACHQEAYDSIHGGSGIPTSCSDCHSQVAWDSVSFDHATVSGGFDLLGRHQEIECTSCHDANTGAPLFEGAKQNQCFICHVDDYERQHGGTGIPTACLDCHTNEGWGVVDFDHATVSGGFDLIGAHAALACSNCHDVNNDNAPFWHPTDENDCLTCHRSDYDVQHTGTGTPTACADCHTVDGPWSNVTFDHAQVSGGFALIGVHDSLACLACHRLDGTPIFTTTNETDCLFCHQAEYDIQHAGTGMPTTCTDCHSVNGPWSNVTFDHAQIAGGFALLGRHQQTACTSCHDPTTFNPLFNAAGHEDCLTCHQADYDLQHAGSGTPTTCLDCHTNDGWGVVDFDHGAVSQGFDLLGAHAAVGCTSCHDPNNGDQTYWNPTDENDCITCHQADYDTQHSGSGFPTTCLQCHSIDTWTGATFDHTQVSGGFEIVGAHDQLDCTGCHQPNGTPLFNTKDETNCIFCHQADYNGPHAGSGIPTTCTDCHTVNGPWTDVWFDHGFASGGFDLVGAHAGLACTVCHDANNGAPLFNTKNENECIVCHQAEYNGQHSGTGIPTTCGDCHTAAGPWLDVTFDHGLASGGFDLIGTHAGLSCTACHDPNNGVPIWQTNDEGLCIACHQSDYDAQHAGTGLPTSGCTDCHTVDGPWSNASFDHATASGGFALAGRHDAIACTKCHDPTGGAPLFQAQGDGDCFACHEDRWTVAHGQGGGTPTTCEDCHTRNAWTEVTFDHDSQFFPIYAGKHRGKWGSCSDCHTDPADYSVFTCLSCHAHSQSRMDDKHRGENGYQYNSARCLDCHPRGIAD